MNAGPDDRDEHGPHHTEILDSHEYYQRRRPRLTSLAVVAVLALAAGGGIAYVATNSGSPARADSAAGAAQAPAASPSASATPQYGHGPGGDRFGPFGGLGFLGPGGLGGAIHGQVTVPKAGGGYQTIDVQSGTVTAVSSSSISVKSADGYTATYAVASATEVNAQAAGIGTVKTGDTVLLTATVSGGKPTAASIIDLTSIRSSHGWFGFPGGPPNGWQKTMPPASGQS